MAILIDHLLRSHDAIPASTHSRHDSSSLIWRTRHPPGISTMTGGLCEKASNDEKWKEAGMNVISARVMM
jgi:hypothetical protein